MENMTLEMALQAYRNPIADLPQRQKPETIQPTKEEREILSKESAERFTQLGIWLDSLALKPSQTMSRTIRTKKRLGKDGVSQFVFRKDRITKKEVIVDRHNQTDANVNLISSYLVSYCLRKLTRLRQGKGKGKGIDFDSGNKEPFTRKRDGKRLLRALPSRYLKGSQDHIRQSGLDDALDSVQEALLFWVESNQRRWLNRLSEAEMVKYIHDCKVAKKCIIPCVSTMTDRKPLTYRILAIGCFKIMRDSFRWSRKVDHKVWENRHGIARVGDELAKDELAKGMPPIVSIPVNEIKEDIRELPEDSRTQRTTKAILLMRVDGVKTADIARTLDLNVGYVKKAIQRFRKANPYLCHKVLTPV